MRTEEGDQSVAYPNDENGLISRTVFEEFVGFVMDTVIVGFFTGSAAVVITSGSEFLLRMGLRDAMYSPGSNVQSKHLSERRRCFDGSGASEAFFAVFVHGAREYHADVEFGEDLLESVSIGLSQE